MPTILQMEAVECGAASLAMILAYYGRWIALEDLRMQCGVTRDGSNAGQLAKVARAHGLVAKGKRLDLEAIRTDSTRPLILFWGFGHFVVFEGMRGDRYQLNDPAGGRRLVDEEEFSKSFTGIALEFDVGPEFEPCGAPPNLLRGVKTWLRGNRVAALFAMLCGMILAIPGIVIPGFTGAFIDRVVQSKDTPSSFWIVVGMLGMVVVQLGIQLVQGMALNRLVLRMFLMQATRLATHLLDLPMRFYLQRSPGDLVQRLASNQVIATNLGNQILQQVVSVGTAMVYAAVLVLMNPLIGGLAAGGAVVLLLCVRTTNRTLVDRSTKVQREVGRQYGVLMAMLRSIRELKATSRESEAFGQWAGYQAKGVNAQQDVARWNAWLDSAPVVLQGVIVYGLVLTLGGWEVMDGRLTIGELVSMQLIAGLLLAPITQMVMLARTLQETQAQMNRVLDVLDYRQPDGPGEAAASETGAGASDEESPRLAGSIGLDEVSFGFDRLKPPFLNGLSMKIEPGRLVALVGPSGCGKSTIADLVLGLEEPWSGSVTFDDRPRKAIGSDRLVASVAGSSGSVAIFEGSIRDNVSMWDPTISEGDLVAALEDADCVELLDRPGGIDAPLDEGGRNLSGGQRQRLEIARCLARRPSVLILDGATSALDGRTEAKLIDRIRLRGCTVLLITSRRSTLGLVDEIAVVADGGIVDRGDLATLAARNEWFASEFGGDG
ncbi:MAG: cysteine peptidase family C39 domain-containing protein [Phycisphaerales bacterium]